MAEASLIRFSLHNRLGLRTRVFHRGEKLVWGKLDLHIDEDYTWQVSDLTFKDDDVDQVFLRDIYLKESYRSE